MLAALLLWVDAATAAIAALLAGRNRMRTGLAWRAEQRREATSSRGREESGEGGERGEHSDEASSSEHAEDAEGGPLFAPPRITTRRYTGEITM